MPLPGVIWALPTAAASDSEPFVGVAKAAPTRRSCGGWRQPSSHEHLANGVAREILHEYERRKRTQFLLGAR
jgi:hypothetical protein